ncbi:MAG TPA: hypothetical protein VEC10_12605, partial [Steroidobacteraceae bacterium]|nr:hypothetical protein [Steroidobacteraceae bacterium]
MTTEPLSEPAHRADLPVKDSLFSEIRRMHAVFWRSQERNQLMLLGAVLVVVIAATAYMQIQLNAWNRPFYDALTHKDVPGFLRQ